MTAAADYAGAITANIRAERARKHLDQRDVAKAMRELGFTNWYPQTLGKIERGERRVFAEEIPGLAIVLGTTPAVLVTV